jgi:chromosome segregation ATPase
LIAMTEAQPDPEGRDLRAEVEEAERRLREAADTAAEAERKVAAEVMALEGELERQRTESAGALEGLRARHEQELSREREAKEQAIAAAEGRLAEIEAQVESAAQRLEAAERRAAEAETALADAGARAREDAAAWLRGQVEAIRRETERG